MGCAPPAVSETRPIACLRDLVELLEPVDGATRARRALIHDYLRCGVPLLTRRSREVFARNSMIVSKGRARVEETLHDFNCCHVWARWSSDNADELIDVASRHLFALLNRTTGGDLSSEGLGNISARRHQQCRHHQEQDLLHLRDPPSPSGDTVNARESAEEGSSATPPLA